MTNAAPHSSAGAPPTSYTTGPGTGMMPRRSSYASVAAGTAATPPDNQTQPVRSGAFSHLMNPNPPSPTHVQNQQPHHRPQNTRQSTDQDTLANGESTVPSSWGRGGYSSVASQYSFGGGYGVSGSGGAGASGFFKPSYLRDSRYIERLETAHKAKLATQREANSIHSSNPGSLSTSSSSVSLHRMAPSHRGMTYEIVEHSPPTDDDGLTPLPSKWAEVDKYGGLEVAADGLDVRYTSLVKPHDHEAAAARSDNPMPPQCGIYYYEVTIVSRGKEGMIGVGFSGTKASLEKLPGWEPDSWAYHGDDGKSFCCQSPGKLYGPKFTTGDVVGCGVNFMTGCAFFTKNGVFQGTAFRDLKDVKLYPSVGMKRPGAQLRVNFGQSLFVFDIDGMISREKAGVGNEINSISVATLHPPLNEDALIKELIAQFLAHDGYVEAAKAFTEEIKAESKALRSRSESLIDSIESQEDFDAVNRQQIRAAILEGDIDKALKRTSAFYPHVLPDNPRIYFRLRCRKFVEMMRQCAELHNGTIEKRPHSYHYHADDIFEQDMELDDPMHNGEDWDKMETEDADNGLKYQTLVDDTLRYAQDLGYEFKDDRSTEVKDGLREIFAMFAYEDPRKSTTAPLLDESGRAPVAEELNSAILVSLGKSSSAAIERLYRQTEVLIGDISEDGGAGAFINVRNDFLVK